MKPAINELNISIKFASNLTPEILHNVWVKEDHQARILEITELDSGDQVRTLVIPYERLSCWETWWSEGEGA